MKRFIAVIISALLLIGSVSALSALADGFYIGDANLDGAVNIKDATHIQRYAAQLVEFSSKELRQADVNLDGAVNIKDTTIVQKYIADLIDSLPVGTATESTTATEAVDKTEVTSVTVEPTESIATEPAPTVPSTEEATEPGEPSKPAVTKPSVDEDGYNNQVVRP